MALDDLMLSHRDYFGSYHDHKEQMAYAATALYLVATAVVVSQAKDVLEWALPREILIFLLSLSAAAGFAFVSWQLRKRQDAADIVRACIAVTTRLASRGNGATTEEAVPIEYKGNCFPKILVDELQSQGQNSALTQTTRIPEYVTYSVMLAWSLAALISVCRAA